MTDTTKTTLGDTELAPAGLPILRGNVAKFARVAVAAE